MKDKGDLYLDRYEGWYSVRDEAYYDEKELVEGEAGEKMSPEGTPVEWTVEDALGEAGPAGWDDEEFEKEIQVIFPTETDLLDGAATAGEVVERAIDDAHRVYDGRREELGEPILKEVERRIVLSVIDNKWREHLSEMDYLRAGINLRAMGNRDPLVEYQNEGYDLFQDLVDNVKRDSVRYLFHVQVNRRTPEPIEAPKITVASSGATVSGAKKPVKVGEKIGRNDPCYCGSGKKYKKCHLLQEQGA